MNALIVLLSLNAAATLPAFAAETVDGRIVRGVLTEWNGESVTLLADELSVQLPLDRLTSLAPAQKQSPTADAATVWVTLTDGTVLAAQSYTAGPEGATAVLPGVGEFELPRGTVDHVRLQPAPPGLLERWEEILRARADRDLLVIAKGDALDYLEGIVRAVRKEELDFDLDGDVLPVKRSKVFGIRRYRPERTEAPQPLFQVTDRNGSIWPMQRVALNEAKDKLFGKTASGLPVSLPLGSIARVEFAASGLVYLSDLTPVSADWTPYIGSADRVASLARLYRPRMDTTLDGDPIVLDGITYERGLALHSRTEMTYRLPEPFERFQAVAGIDDRLRPRGNVDLKILGDDRVLLEAAIDGTDSGRPIDIDLKGVKALTILVDFGADMDVSDHLLLGEARLIK